MTAVSKLKSYPAKAGTADIKWIGPEKCLGPHRVGDTIVLVTGPEVEFFSLQEGRQFLYKQRNEDLRPDSQFSYVYFGGTDESVFFRTMRPQAWFAYQNGGEEAFYNALKPPVIRNLELIYGSGKTQRQGDIYAYPVGISWQRLFEDWLDIFTSRSFSLREVDKDHAVELFGTGSHAITDGRVFSGNFRLDGIGGLVAFNDSVQLSNAFTGVCPMLLAEGTISAPDHEDLDLEGVHLVTQSALLNLRTVERD